MSALTVSELTGLRDELVRQLGRGVLSVKDGDEEITYTSPGAMQRAIAALENRIAGMQSGAPSRYLISTSKGV